MWNVEDDFRDISENFPHTFQIIIFACCREVYNPIKHCGGFPSKAEAEKFYAKIKSEEQAKILAMRGVEAKENPDSDEEAKKQDAEDD